MGIKLRFFASHREIIGRSELYIPLQEGITVGELWHQLQQEYPELAPLSASTIFAVNREFVGRETMLGDGDEVALMPPVSGGQDLLQVTEQQLYAIVEQPLDPESIIEMVTDETVGAVVIFVGIVRRFSRGKRIKRLEYEAYQAMAEAKLREIGHEIKERWDIDGVAIVHRIGFLDVEEKSVVIAVGAPHRAEAFEACRYAIEQLKKTVPIWKKEVYEDGEVWTTEGS